MKVAIIGSGIVGRVLAAGFAKEGYEVSIGTRDTTKEELVKFQSENPGITIGTIKDVATDAAIILLAVSGDAALAALDLAGKENLSGKLLIDATNPIAKEPPTDGVLKFFTDSNNSLMEQIQAHVPEAKVVKAFNSVGNAFMYKPDFAGIKPTMFICGNDADAKKTVTEILDKFGWETEDMGKATSARVIEQLCILWCLPGFLNNQWQHAFKLLKK
ncbi:MAG TPA: NAD(P)-binding domain-containing protein [Ferruginibacter sp.]|nr:NAD(P)-binding domain-containing protein [Ferruginibacter sp.]